MDRFLIKRPRLALNNDGETESRTEGADVSDGTNINDNDSVEAVGNVQPQVRVHVNDVNSGDTDRPSTTVVTDDVAALPTIPEAPILRQSQSAPSSRKPKRKFNPKWSEHYPWIR